MSYISRILEEDINASFRNQKVLLLLGARQVGKTTLIGHMLQTYLGDSLNMDNEIDRHNLKQAAKVEPAEGVRMLTRGKVLVIDEAHRVPEIGRITKGWYDSKVPVKIVLLGSSSANLLDRAAGELVGRNEKLWLTPLLFREILSQQKWFTSLPPNQKVPALVAENYSQQIKTLLIQRLVFGSYPDAYLTPDPRLYLSELATDHLFKDIFATASVRSSGDIKQLLMELAGNIGDTVSVLQLATRLKLSRQTIERYLRLLEESFIIFSLPAYSTDPSREITKSNKYFFWDTGVKNALLREWTVSHERSDIEELWQNWVIAEVMKISRTLRRHEDLFFWRSRRNSNVELIIKQGSALHPFTIRFESNQYSPSRAFQNMYGLTPKTIHPGNVLEVLL